LISIEELEILVRLGEKWEIPSIIWSWRAKGHSRPLLLDLLDKAQLSGIDPWGHHIDLGAWLNLVPGEGTTSS
jgi:hypothetical protein